jgi:Uma2 family endonuclease
LYHKLSFSFRIAIVLKRNDRDWAPVPDLTYISFARLSADWMEDEACPVAPELVIEIISPGQSFGDLAEKATDYLNAGVLRVWIVDTQGRSITIFNPSTPPQTVRGKSPITDSLLEGLETTPQQIFDRAGFRENQ